jgi:EC042_2821-lke REase
VLSLDSAEITDKIHKYTNTQFADFTIQRCEKAGNILAALIVQETPIPLVFEKPGTYDIGGGKQRTAFGMGTVYFRHGPKSEPGNSDDLRKGFDRLLVTVRESWLKNVRQVVEAPLGSTVVTISPTRDPAALPVRISDDPNALIIGGMSPDRTHAYRLKELVEAINQHLPADKQINQYDVQCVRKMYDVEKNLTFHYLPKFGGHQYSPAFSEWIMNQYQANSTFFQKARQDMQERRIAAKNSAG